MPTVDDKLVVYPELDLCNLEQVVQQPLVEAMARHHWKKGKMGAKDEQKASKTSKAVNSKTAAVQKEEEKPLKKKKEEVVEEEEEEEEDDEEAMDEEEYESYSDDGDDDDDEDDDDEEDEEIKMFGKIEDDEDDDDEEEEVKGKGKQAARPVDSKKGGGEDRKKSKGAAGGGGNKQEQGMDKKRKRRASNKDDDDESGVMNVTFDFSDPDEKFFFGIRALLGFLTHEGVNVSSLAELVVQEPGLGSIVHCADETDVFALASVLGLEQHKEEESIKQIKSLLERRCPPSLLPSLQSALSDPGTYLLLHHRFVNLPLPLVPLLHKSIRDDMAWAAKNTKGMGAIKKLVLLCPCTSDLGKSSHVAYAPSDAIYSHFEDEILVQKSELSFCFRRASPAVAAGGEEASSSSKKGKKKKKGGGGGGGGGGEEEEEGAGAMVVCVVEDKDHARSLPEIEQMTGQLA